MDYRRTSRGSGFENECDHEEVIWVCSECHAGVCPKCATTFHNKHKFVDIADYKKQQKPMLDDILRAMGDLVKKSHDQRKSLLENEIEMETTLHKRNDDLNKILKTVIKECFFEQSRICETITNRRKIRLHEISDEYCSWMNNLKEKVRTCDKIKDSNEIKDFVEALKLSKEIENLLENMPEIPSLEEEWMYLVSEGNLEESEVRDAFGTVK